MKKFRRIFSFLLALVFCFAAMSYNVLAADYCTQHRNADWYTSPMPYDGVAYYHYYCCAECDNAFDVELCGFVTVYDCTQSTHCYMCDRTKSGFATHVYDYSKAYAYDANRHYYTCANSIDCESRTFGYHNYQLNPDTGDLECIECHRVVK